MTSLYIDCKRTCTTACFVSCEWSGRKFIGSVSSQRAKTKLNKETDFAYVSFRKFENLYRS